MELLLALFISALSAGALYGMFGAGLEAWRRGTNRSRLSFQATFVGDMLARELRGAFEMETDKYACFKGEETSVEFFTVAGRAGQCAWPVRHVRYWFERDSVESFDGAIYVEVLPFAGTVPLVDEAAREVLAEGVCGFGIRYYQNGRWEEKWQAEGLPRAVEIHAEIATDDGRERQSFAICADLVCSIPKGS